MCDQSASPSRTSICSKRARTQCAKRWSSRRRRVEILRVIASSPTDIQPVLGRGRRERRAAVRVPTTRVILRVEGDSSALVVAHHGPMPGLVQCDAADQSRHRQRPGDAGPADRSRRRSRRQSRDRVPEDSDARSEQLGTRSLLVVPLLREGVESACPDPRRMGVRPFTELQIALLESFADQAVIAIENARLFQELEESNSEMTEALEQQTATAEVLRVIAARRPTSSRCSTPIAEPPLRLCEPAASIIRVGWRRSLDAVATMRPSLACRRTARCPQRGQYRPLRAVAAAGPYGRVSTS